MIFDFREYWTTRSARQGPSYVGPGGDPERTEAQKHRFVGPLLHAVGYAETLLDFGCGPGRFTPWLSQVAVDYVGCDVVEHELPYGEFVHLTGDQLPFVAGYFECVAAVTVLQHIEDGAHWCSELARVVGEAGRIVVIDNDPLEREAAHVFTRDPDQVAALLGMEIVDLGRASDDHWLAVYE